MNHDLKDFIENNEPVPALLYADTLKLAHIAQKPLPLILKFFTLNLLGALATLSICPQYGFGPFVFSHLIMNVMMSYGPVVCGIFCASVFFFGGHALSFFFLTRPEKKWIVRHGLVMVIPYVSFLFMLGMGMKSIAPGHVHHDVFSYYGSWLITAFAISVLFLKVLGSRATSGSLVHQG